MYSKAVELQRDRIGKTHRAKIAVSVAIVVDSIILCIFMAGLVKMLNEPFTIFNIGLEVIAVVFAVGFAIMIISTVLQLKEICDIEYKSDRLKLLTIDDRLDFILEHIKSIEKDIDNINKNYYIERTVQSENHIIRVMAKRYSNYKWTKDIIKNKMELVRLGSDLEAERRRLKRKLMEFSNKLYELDRASDEITQDDVDRLANDIDEYLMGLMD